MNTARKQPQSIDSRILAAIRRRGNGSVLVPADFLDIGSREAVDVALHRLTRKGTLRRLARGVYDYPKVHPVLVPGRILIAFVAELGLYEFWVF
jgi:predicted transcriptional regulator of viral defense system